MAQVVQDPKTLSWVDDDLDYLLQEWSELPVIAEEWANWDELDRLVFVVEWPMRVERQLRVRYWSDRGELTPDQLRRYRAFLDLEVRHRPILDRLLAD